MVCCKSLTFLALLAVLHLKLSTVWGIADDEGHNVRSLRLRRRRGQNPCNTKRKFPPPPRFSNKKGFGITLRAIGEDGSFLTNLPKLLALETDWSYSWSPNRIDQQPNSSLFVPMIWGGNRNASALAEVINKSNIRAMIEKGVVKHVMGFNEPDERTQSNLTVDAAIDRWPLIHSLGVPLVSPSCMQPGGEWMIEFMKKAAAGCLRVDYLGVHWYGSPNFENFKATMKRHYDQHKMPLVITEFAPADWAANTTSQNRFTQAQTLSFMKEAIPWLESTTWIYSYSWFNFKDTNPHGWTSALFDSNGNLTALGRFYKSVRTGNRRGDQTIQADL